MKKACIPIGAITVTGFASTLGQILVVRELLVLFYGNELSTGLIFTAWLLWTAAGSNIGGKIAPVFIPKPIAGNETRITLAIFLTLLGLLLLATLLWIRASRFLWHISPGELLSLSKMIGISFSATGPLCLLSGFLFSLTWAIYNSEFQVENQKLEIENPQPIAIYLGEALGAAFGGIIFYFILVPYFSVLTSAFIISFFILITALILLWQGMKKQTGSLKEFAFWGWLFVFMLMIIGFSFISSLEHFSRRWQWGRHLITVQDTPYHNLSLIKDKNQFTLFVNGLWSFSIPDPESAEKSAHLALLQHPHPETVLLIGGGIAGLIHEILKHPSVRQIDYIEPDPGLIRLAQEHLPNAMTAPLHTPFVRLFHEDAGRFIRQTDQTYDLILMNVGDPINAQMNRFYTIEFFQEIQKHLTHDAKELVGIFSFAVSSAPDMLGPAQIQFLRSVYQTLCGVFPQVILFPGDNARFFATGKQRELITEPDMLISRMAARNLRLQYIQEYYLFNMLNPLRLNYFRSILHPLTNSHEFRNSEQLTQYDNHINRNFKPTCYFYNLILWGTQVHEGFKDILITISKISQKWLWTGVNIVILLMIGMLATGRSKSVKSVGASVMLVGGMQITLEIVLLLGFQILSGFLYTQLALIIAFFMGGLALGTGIVAWFSANTTSGVQSCALDVSKIIRPRHSLGLLRKVPRHSLGLRKWLILVQTLLSLYLISIIGLFLLLQHLMQQGSLAVPLGLIFSIFALIAGMLGGSHFSLAVKTISGSAIPSVKTGGGLYALDLVGSAAGALIASLFLLPVYGLVSTLVIFSLLGMGSVVTLFLSHE